MFPFHFLTQELYMCIKINTSLKKPKCYCIWCCNNLVKGCQMHLFLKQTQMRRRNVSSGFGLPLVSWLPSFNIRITQAALQMMLGIVLGQRSDRWCRTWILTFFPMEVQYSFSLLMVLARIMQCHPLRERVHIIFQIQKITSDIAFTIYISHSILLQLNNLIKLFILEAVYLFYSSP